MIVFKTWKVIKTKDYEIKATYLWSGWFLFSIIPLYLRRKNLDLQI